MSDYDVCSWSVCFSLRISSVYRIDLFDLACGLFLKSRYCNLSSPSPSCESSSRSSNIFCWEDSEFSNISSIVPTCCLPSRLLLSALSRLLLSFRGVVDYAFLLLFFFSLKSMSSSGSSSKSTTSIRSSAVSAFLAYGFF